jgi:hypothetical protein
MLLVSGSGYTADTGTIGMQVQLDGTDVADAQVCANSTETHMAFVSQYVLITDDQKHTLTLSPWSNTITDENDYFVVAFLPQDPGARVR